jgi:hypothetical protein
MDIHREPSSYEPRYARVSDVPIEVDDRYNEGPKREALYLAETELELERTGGIPVAESNYETLTEGHVTAVLNLATYFLVRSATSPDDVTLGDLEDDGEQTERHAEQYLETYHRLVERMSESANDDPGTYMGHTGKSEGVMSVNTGDTARRHNLDEVVRYLNVSDLVHERYTVD